MKVFGIQFVFSTTENGLCHAPAYITYDTRTTTSVRVGNKGINMSYNAVDGVEQSVTIFR